MESDFVLPCYTFSSENRTMSNLVKTGYFLLNICSETAQNCTLLFTMFLPLNLTLSAKLSIKQHIQIYEEYKDRASGPWRAPSSFCSPSASCRKLFSQTKEIFYITFTLTNKYRICPKGQWTVKTGRYMVISFFFSLRNKMRGKWRKETQ